VYSQGAPLPAWRFAHRAAHRARSASWDRCLSYRPWQ